MWRRSQPGHSHKSSLLSNHPRACCIDGVFWPEYPSEADLAVLQEGIKIKEPGTGRRIWPPSVENWRRKLFKDRAKAMGGLLYKMMTFEDQLYHLTRPEKEAMDYGRQSVVVASQAPLHNLSNREFRSVLRTKNRRGDCATTGSSRSNTVHSFPSPPLPLPSSLVPTAKRTED